MPYGTPLVRSEGESADNEARIAVHFHDDGAEPDYTVTYIVTPEGIICDVVHKGEVVSTSWNEHPTLEGV